MNQPLILQGAGASHVLAPVQTVGRSHECDVVLSDLTVSRVHARIVVERDRVTVRDLTSQNGTFVNGVRISSAEVPIDGTIAFGAVSMQLRVGSSDDLAEGMANQSTDRLSRKQQPPTHLLSAAEHRVLNLLLEGLPEKGVAERLHLSQHTVHNHVKSIYQTLNVTSRAALLRLLLGADDPEERPTSG